MQIAVVAIGYNRVDSYKRLINSLCNADYLGDKVDLIMSIDNCGMSIVEDYAKTVKWRFGNTYIKTYKKRLGLRSHILKCGELLNDYDAIAVFEDDLIVSPAFYSYAKQCVIRYCDDLNIAGISLYTHLLNVDMLYPFTPHSSVYDIFFMQYAMSWGQVWLKKQWKEFMEWYDLNSDEFVMNNNIPKNIAQWGNNSWLKYHIKYCIDRNKFFVYPYYSLTSCFTEPGEHNVKQDNRFHTPMLTDCLKYRLPEFGSEDAVYYDAFFERLFLLSKVLKLNEEELTVDLYGAKENCYGSTRYLLTSQRCNYKKIGSFGRNLRPHEDNIVFDIPGNDFFLYDLKERNDEEKKYLKKNFESDKYVFYYKIGGRTMDLFYVSLNKIIETIKIKFHRKKK